MTVSQKKRTAYHESGHVVVGHALGLSMIGATVSPHGEKLGAVISDQFDGSTRAAVWAASGPCAEYLFLESVGERQDIPGAARDWENVETAIATLLPEVTGSIGRNEFFDNPVVVATILDAKNLCLQHWNTIKLVSSYLLTRGTLHKDDLQTVLTGGVLTTPREPEEPARLAARTIPNKPARAMFGPERSIIGRPIGRAFQDEFLAEHGLPPRNQWTAEKVQQLINDCAHACGANTQSRSSIPTVRASQSRLAAQRAAGKRAWQEANERLGVV